MSWVLSSQFRGGIETKRAAINGLPLKTSGLLNKIDREQLYQAFSKLHTLCQAYNKTFDSPAVLVVGHQTSGKSALIEALMGFQFNEVGGGTTTRRPISLQMQYNPNCTEPICYLTLNGNKEMVKTLEEIQQYIEQQNARLEAAQTFENKDILIRIEYKYCPNMIIIDTPGLIHAPKGLDLTPQQQAMADAARDAEALVVEKMRCKDYLILCVEDTTDWKHATTRNIVMQEDPLLARTVLVTTKLDTKIPQFSDPDDLKGFLRADIVKQLFPKLLGGPFFTSVPSGRVGARKEFQDNTEFIHSLRKAEATDLARISSRFGSKVDISTHNKVGIAHLRLFLEKRIEDTYRSSVRRFVPLLQRELVSAQVALGEVESELAALDGVGFAHSLHAYREDFSKVLVDVIHGTARASALEWGQTIGAEQTDNLSFSAVVADLDGKKWSDIVSTEVGNAEHKLFGGAQYHRALREFSAAVRHMREVTISDDEIANVAGGVGETHDGVNIMRTACVLALNKAQVAFDPILDVLQHRCEYIMKRLYPIVNSIVTVSENRDRLSDNTHVSLSTLKTRESSRRRRERLVREIFDKFVDEQMAQCLEKCRDDLRGITRFVTWDIATKGGADLVALLRESTPSAKTITDLYSVVAEERSSSTPSAAPVEALALLPSPTISNANTASISLLKAALGRAARSLFAPSEDGAINLESDSGMLQIKHSELASFTEDLLGSRVGSNGLVVKALIRFILRSWQEQFAKSVVTKFNCFFLLPFIDTFPSYLRKEIDRIQKERERSHVNSLEIEERRMELQNTRASLIAECKANLNLQSEFEAILSVRFGGNSPIDFDAGEHMDGTADAPTIVDECKEWKENIGQSEGKRVSFRTHLLTRRSKTASSIM